MRHPFQTPCSELGLLLTLPWGGQGRGAFRYVPESMAGTEWNSVGCKSTQQHSYNAQLTCGQHQWWCLHKQEYSGLCEKAGLGHVQLCLPAMPARTLVTSQWRLGMALAAGWAGEDPPAACTTHRPQPGLQRPVPGRWLKRGSSS